MRPNIELSSLFLPELENYKSIVLLIIGAFIFTILGCCFKIIISYIIILIFWIRLMIFLEDFYFFDPLLSEVNSFAGIWLLYVPLSFMINLFEKEINLMIKITYFLDRISLITRKINRGFIRKENGLIDWIVKKLKKTTNTSKSLSVNRGRAIKSYLLDIFIGFTTLPIFCQLYWLIIGILLFLFVEYLGIWILSFSPFFLLLCTFITVRNFYN
ncbi:hypothetical protein [Pleurocapsa sp. PCC 7319]|uniref:hypothetical protein n=1 Tax=Pleurocapsa sp. PCC 7319 TaxID=118161 RepID=UPI001ED9C1B5|nr:hypothetical protein [Pleurocapsa sp. PCC 7319]